MSTESERDPGCDETLRVEAVIAAGIDRAVEGADFSDIPLPDFSGVTPDPYQLLAKLAGGTDVSAATRERLAAALVELGSTETSTRL